MFSLSQKTKAMTRRPLSAAIGGDVSHVATANETDVTLLMWRCNSQRIWCDAADMTLRGNYGDLERKEVWQSFVVLIIILSNENAN